MNARLGSWGWALFAVGLSLCSCSDRDHGTEPTATRAAPVIGGEQAVAGFAPYQVQISNPEFPALNWCGGALLSSRWFVTAAHCLQYANHPYDLKVTLGERSRSANDGTEQVFRITNYVQHPLALSDDVNNDIAVVQLDRDATLNQWVSPIALPAGRHDHTHTGVVTGWGQTIQMYQLPDGGTPPSSDLLMKASLPIVDNGTCGTTLGDPSLVHPSMVCAGYANGSKSGCHGDSGGPFVVKNASNVNELVGIVSWGPAACTSYSVFTRVSDYVPWIKNIVSGTPRLGCQGQTPAGATNWQAYGANSLYLEVDTSQCAYTATPQYFTSLEGTQGHVNALGATSIYAPTATGFTVYVNRSSISPAEANALKWRINWHATPLYTSESSLCSGRTSPTATSWSAFNSQTIYTDVNTTRCGLTNTPRYFTSLGGNSNHYQAAGVTSIVAPTKDGFRVFVTLAAGITPALANQRQWHVNWEAVPSGSLTSPEQCAGNTLAGSGWNQASTGPGSIYTFVDTSACNRQQTPLYFSSLTGGGVIPFARGVNSFQSVTKNGFYVYVTYAGLTPSHAASNGWSINWAAYP